MSRRTLSLAVAALVAVGLSGCTSNEPTKDSSSGSGKLAVSSTTDKCELSTKEAPAGNLVFNVTNKGTKVTEFYLLGEDGLRIVGEVENIAPGLSRDLVVRAPAGKYFTACKPGMVGKGIRSDFTVTKSDANLEPTGDDKVLADNASTQYGSYVKDQTEQLLTQTTTFVGLYKSGKDDEARKLYADARMHWERVEPVAESFGDLDPKMDLREADLEPGQKWTGWHRIEKDLWPPKSGYTKLTPTERTTIADQLLKDTKTLYTRTRTAKYPTDKISNGSKELMDEVATGKVTGEEEKWSHTDLWDFQANVDGARIGFEGVRPIVKKKNAALDSSIATKFTALQKLLDKHKKGTGFKLYNELTPAEIKELSTGVNALSEPLSKLTAAVTL
ncbi:iron uptake system protein EfeO [Luteipulveratus mongoliensis]|uniref:PbrT family lead (Pb2+) uptake porter n=1 Tax=Luteipulveratus mongoliensis TaxID=571913 RepID=A0A0K1JL16_9MICO|nr:iron uptake system protein EfeO [Luteipulveratus mongoliensis]AKU17406.1 PbrT family lead (Pb2+) uptake porter [Luteipulveratus mongoliensis]